MLEKTGLVQPGPTPTCLDSWREGTQVESRAEYGTPD